MASMWSKADQSEWDLGTFARNAGIKARIFFQPENVQLLIPGSYLLTIKEKSIE